MDAAHLHLIVNHFPIAGMIFSLPLLIYALWRKNESISRAALFAVFMTGLITIPTYLSGEPSEEIIEHLPGISEQIIKLHEEAAEKAVWVIGAAALAALLCLLISYKKKSSPKWLLAVVTILSVGSMGALAWTNNLGGPISHPELRKATVSSAHAGGEKNEAESEDED